MTTETLNGYLLHKRWSGDTSVMATFFTREKGLLRCTYKGGRTSKKQAQLQPLMPLWLSLSERGQWHYARQVEASGAPFIFKDSALFSALYLNEILFYALKPNDLHEGLFEAYEQTLLQLSVLNDKQAIEAQLRRFEWHLLTSCGYGLSFSQEARTNHPIHPELLYHFVAGEGFIQSGQGIPGRYLLALAHDDLEDPGSLKAAKLIMRKAIDHLLDGREIKARALYTRDLSKGEF